MLDAADEVLGRRAFVVPRALGGSGPAPVVYDESEEEEEKEAEDPNKKRFDFWLKLKFMLRSFEAHVDETLCLEIGAMKIFKL